MYWNSLKYTIYAVTQTCMYDDNCFAHCQYYECHNIYYTYIFQLKMLFYNILKKNNTIAIRTAIYFNHMVLIHHLGSPYRDKISDAILILQEKGRIQMMYNKWWKNSGTCSHDDKKKDSKASSLGVENVGGIFVVLLGGLALAVIVAVFEFMWNSRKNTNSEKAQVI